MALFLLFASSSYSGIEALFHEPEQNIVLTTQQIVLDSFPDAFNPSLIKLDPGFLLLFRYCPNRSEQPWLSHIGVVQLNASFEPITAPQLLNTRPQNSKTPSQAEDARFFTYRDKLFLIYNDNIDEIFFDPGKRRDLFIAALFFAEGRYQLSSPLKLFFEEKYHSVWQQKNWVPFEWQNNLFFSYSIHPHQVLSVNLKNGNCYSLHKTTPPLQWPYGSPRGSSQAQLIDGEYFAFFHSSAKTRSPASYDWQLWHYFMGAYTFSAEPPFELTKITPKPIMSDAFYTPSYREKRVVFPGGFVVDGSSIYVAYGKDDCEMWIATLDKEALKQAMVPVEK